MYTESFFKKSKCQFIGNQLMWGNHQHWIYSKLFLHNNSNLYTTNNDVYTVYDRQQYVFHYMSILKFWPIQ